MTFAIIVASSRARGGKTLLTRLLAEHFILGGMQPAIFDTDAAAPLVARFPSEASALDVDRVTDQMALFDGLSAPAANSRIVDLSHRAYKKFFDLMRKSDYVSEARANGIEPAIFYILGTDLEALERANDLRYDIGDCPFVCVENASLGEIKRSIQGSDEYRMLSELPTRMLLPALDRSFMEVIEEADISLSEFMREPTRKMSAEMRTAIRLWLMQALSEIYRVLKLLESRERVRPVR